MSFSQLYILYLVSSMPYRLPPWKFHKIVLYNFLSPSNEVVSYLVVSFITDQSGLLLQLHSSQLIRIFSSGCGNNAYRCVNGRGSVEDDWKVTRECIEKVGFDSTCFCSHMWETYADPYGSDINEFKKCCAGYDGYYAREC